MTAYGTVLTAGYRGDGLRGWKQTSSGRTYFLYDGIVPVCEMNGSGSVTAVNVFGGDGLVGRSGTANVYYVFDQQGNVAQRLDSSQNVLSSSTYDAYGAETTTGSPSDPFGYNAQWGYHTDRATGLVLCAHRYYDPATGGWLTRDPISYAGGLNLYGYCGAGPVDWADADGYGAFYSKLSRYAMDGGYGPMSPKDCEKLREDLARAESKLKKWRGRGWDRIGNDPGGKPISPRKGGGLTKPGGHYTKYQDFDRGVQKLRDAVRRYCPDDPLGGSPCPEPVPVVIPKSRRAIDDATECAAVVGAAYVIYRIGKAAFCIAAAPETGGGSLIFAFTP
jgi:RHS repeat-associated protein